MLPRLGLLILCLLISLLRVGAQPPAGLTLAGLDVLPDRGYSWDRVRTDSTLAFAPADSLRPAQARQYWLRLTVHNPSRYAEAARLLVRPNLDNTLFYYDEDQHAWRSRRAGVGVSTDSQRTKGRLRLRVPGQARLTCYVRLRLGERARLPAAVLLRAELEQEATAQEADRFSNVAGAVSLAVLLLLLLANLFAYVRFRDRSTRYYIWAQVGAMLYLLAYQGYFRVLLPGPVFSQLLLPSGLSYGYSPNNLLMHLSVLLLLGGLGQMTRAYLATRSRLPRLDAALRAALAGYGGFTAVVALVNLSGFYLDQYTLRYDNLLVLGVLGLLLATVLTAYRRRLPLARAYLLANVLPLLFVVALAGYHVFVSFDYNGNLLPDLAIVSHALCFAAALNVRLQHLQHSLLATEREAAELALDIQQKELRNREIVLKNSHIQAALRSLQQEQQASAQQARQLSAEHEQQQVTNQDLREQLEANQRELASTTLYVNQKNALLAELKQQIQELHAQRPGRKKELSGIESLLQSNLYLDEDWSKFKLHFEQVHPRFFEELQARYPALTKHEQRLYCYFHINLSTKEIAALLNIDPASVRRAKTRLYKKIAAADQAAGRSPSADGPEELPTNE